MYGYSPKIKALMGKCTGTIQKKMGPHILKKGATLRNVLVQLSNVKLKGRQKNHEQSKAPQAQGGICAS
jgi:hypothetical protein